MKNVRSRTSTASEPRERSGAEGVPASERAGGIRRGEAPRKRTTIAVQGARVHNLKNVSLEIPRDSLIVVTGLSGSGKSSLAFDTIYAEGQRRYMESLSSFARRFVSQVTKPDVDFVFGLSPVISIEQKTLTSNPRSTVGTMTDIASYLNLLYATIGQPHCPRTGEPTPSVSSSQILESILSLPDGAEIELRAPVFKVYGEELDFVLTDVRKKGCRWLIVDGKRIDISAETALDESTVRNMEAVVDRFVVSRRHEKAIKAGIASTLARRRRSDADRRPQRAPPKRRPRAFTRGCAAKLTTSFMETSTRRFSCSTTRRARAARAVVWAWTSSRTRSC